MRVLCHLREIRGERSLAQISVASDVPISSLSKIERGIEIPRDEWLTGMAAAYGVPVTAWYPPTVLLALAQDSTS